LLARLLRASAALQRAVGRTAAVGGMVPLPARASAHRTWSERLAWSLRGTAATLLLGLVSTSVSAIVQRALPAIRPAAAAVRVVPVAPKALPAIGTVRPAALTLAVARTDGNGGRSARPRRIDETPVRRQPTRKDLVVSP
jgi:hypothetical protein